MNGIRHSSTFRYHQSKIFEKLSKSKKLATQFNQERTKFDTMTVRYKKKFQNPRTHTQFCSNGSQVFTI